MGLNTKIEYVDSTWNPVRGGRTYVPLKENVVEWGK